MSIHGLDDHGIGIGTGVARVHRSSPTGSGGLACLRFLARSISASSKHRLREVSHECLRNSSYDRLLPESHAAAARACASVQRHPDSALSTFRRTVWRTPYLPRDAAAAFQEIGAGHAGTGQSDAPHRLMHRTETIDYGVVLGDKVWETVRRMFLLLDSRHAGSLRR